MELARRSAGAHATERHVRIVAAAAADAAPHARLLPLLVRGRPTLRAAGAAGCCAPDDVQLIPVEVEGQPDQYASVRDMRVDKAKVGSARVFRCEGWTGPLIVSGEIKDALELMGATGIRFEEL
jgi:hypothetical protein